MLPPWRVVQNGLRDLFHDLGQEQTFIERLLGCLHTAPVEFQRGWRLLWSKHGQHRNDACGAADGATRTGTLPSELGQLGALEILNLSNNEGLSGKSKCALGVMDSTLYSRKCFFCYWNMFLRWAPRTGLRVSNDRHLVCSTMALVVDCTAHNPPCALRAG